MRGRAKGLVASAAAVALVGAIALLALLRTDDGREIAGEAKSTGWQWADTVAATSRRWFDLAVGARHWEGGATFDGLTYRISEQQSTRWSNRRVSAYAESVGRHQLTRVQLMAGVDRNGDGRIEAGEWTRIAVAESTEATPPTRLSTPEIEVAQNVVACWIRIEGVPLGSFDASLYEEGVEVEMK